MTNPDELGRNFTAVRYHQVIDCSRRRLGMLIRYVAYHTDGSTANLETVADSM